MKKRHLILCSLGLALSIGVAYGQPVEAPEPTQPTVTAIASDAGAATAAEVPADAGPEVGSNEDLVRQLQEVKAAYDAVSDAEDLDKFLVAALIAAIAGLLISVIKRVGKMTPAGKKWLPWVAVSLGVLVGVTAYYATGSSLFDAILYGGAAPGAVLFHELLKAFKKS